MTDGLINLFGWSEQTWLWLDQIGILMGNILMSLSIAGAPWAWIRRDNIRRWLSGNQFPHVGGSAHEHWDTLIFTLSRPEVPLWVIEQTGARNVGLVATEMSMAAAHQIRDRIIAAGGDCRIESIGNPDDPADARERVRTLLRKLQREGESIAVDITGGKVPMSLGAFMAAEEARVTTLYVTTKYDNGKPVLGTADIVHVSQPGND